MALDITLPLRKGRGGTSKNWKSRYLESLEKFANDMIKIQAGLDFQMSSRGWCYVLEPHGLNKGDFSWAQTQINNARREGFLEPGFILEEEGHKVQAEPDEDWTPDEYVDYQFDKWQSAKGTFEDCDSVYGTSVVSFWDDKSYFIQLLVEKSDLKSLFSDVCDKYKIPIANMRGWGSIEQKAEMARRFKEAEKDGKIPILLVCCDFDPPGIGISDALINTFKKLTLFSGWSPDNLRIDRIGLNFDFIEKNKLTWIEGLATISGRDLSDPNHKFYINNVYGIRDYIDDYGAKKCEANAIVVAPELGRQMLIDKIEEYLGKDCYDKFVEEIDNRKIEVRDLVKEKLKEMGEYDGDEDGEDEDD